MGKTIEQLNREIQDQIAEIVNLEHDLDEVKKENAKLLAIIKKMRHVLVSNPI